MEFILYEAIIYNPTDIIYYASVIGGLMLMLYIKESGVMSQMTPYSIHSALLLTQAQVVHCVGKRVSFGIPPQLSTLSTSFTFWRRGNLFSKEKVPTLKFL